MPIKTHFGAKVRSMAPGQFCCDTAMEKEVRSEALSGKQHETATRSHVRSQRMPEFGRLRARRKTKRSESVGELKSGNFFFITVKASKSCLRGDVVHQENLDHFHGEQ